MDKVILIFLDGVGIGKNDPSINPFFKTKFRIFENLFGKTPHLDDRKLEKNNLYIFPSDACLGIDGIPQSGTGQVSIYAGINAPKILGRHIGPFPHTTHLKYLAETSIISELKKRDKKFTFVNAYPKLFFEYINSGKQRLSATSKMFLLNNQKLNDENDLLNGNALTAEIDNSRWNERLGYNLPLFSPEYAAERLLKISRNNDFTLYEYYLTDHLGHGRNKEIFASAMDTLDRFLFHTISNIDEETTLLICSDHGNLEDISIKMHTRNQALTISAGKYAKKLSESIIDLTGIKKVLLEIIN
ncbi:MAG: alkaline phosphatase family protein [Melioribacteraceae bacterium]|nr:alkaline phosphatase family protein [Melioribacteraceae bacterium]MCF8354419.1 alkaline phosphatase family protein [Melioribacteraceae bacterium]MCF8392984.1 alkaline phosphatase family protein [Melioribacteraceae bacterium]MCF8417273.1 alkaline phosphatase family protein [Melioribacteraceae bacterium]